MFQKDFYGSNRIGLHQRAPKGSEGGILVKDNVCQEYVIKEEDISYDAIIGLSLEHKVSKFKCLILPYYLSPENGP